LYSLQKGWETTDYHGFAGDRKRLIASLKQVQGVEPDLLVPSHGDLVRDPVASIDRLESRLERYYREYVSISALRHYFPGLFAEYGDLGMPFVPEKPCPDFLCHIGTSWIVQSRDRSAFVIDCGSPEVIATLQDMQACGTIGEIEWLWITHYHDDHVDAIPQFVDTFGCPVVADQSVASVVAEPLAWRLPCISPARVAIDHKTVHGQRWQWHEFTVTAYHLPGQTLYHGALVVEGRGVRLLFAGDSFTRAGIDDYCPGNRNFLGRGVGFDACLELVEKLTPDYILNCHIDGVFTFRPQECQYMRANLAWRVQLAKELLPWDDPNYGLDEHWVRCHPYEQHVPAGHMAHLCVVVTNHSSQPHEATAQPCLPEEWSVSLPVEETTVSPRSESCLPFSFTVPSHAQRRCWIIPIELAYGGRALGQFREAILVVT
jgi:glyoxylase-like metal-dependent hydrolase (beta-lactamase superfamily II)